MFQLMVGGKMLLADSTLGWLITLNWLCGCTGVGIELLRPQSVIAKTSAAWAMLMPLQPENAYWRCLQTSKR